MDGRGWGLGIEGAYGTNSSRRLREVEVGAKARTATSNDHICGMSVRRKWTNITLISVKCNTLSVMCAQEDGGGLRTIESLLTPLSWGTSSDDLLVDLWASALRREDKTSSSTPASNIQNCGPHLSP